MIQQTTALLRFIWSLPSWRDNIIAIFEQWVLDGISRGAVAPKLRPIIDAYLFEKNTQNVLDINLEQVNWDQITEFLCNCYYRRHLQGSLPDIPSDDLWVKLSDKETWGALSPHPQQDIAIKETVPTPLFPLEQKLLVHGGTRMVYRYEPDRKALLERGVVIDGCVKFIPREQRNCHANAAHIWNENKDRLTIATGYALSEDGLWRQHSWLVQKDTSLEQSYIFETTSKRMKYFGIILTSSEAEAFYKMNR